MQRVNLEDLRMPDYLNIDAYDPKTRQCEVTYHQPTHYLSIESNKGEKHRPNKGWHKFGYINSSFRGIFHTEKWYSYLVGYYLALYSDLLIIEYNHVDSDDYYHISDPKEIHQFKHIPYAYTYPRRVSIGNNPNHLKPASMFFTTPKSILQAIDVLTNNIKTDKDTNLEDYKNILRIYRNFILAKYCDIFAPGNQLELLQHVLTETPKLKAAFDASFVASINIDIDPAAIHLKMFARYKELALARPDRRNVYDLQAAHHYEQVMNLGFSDYTELGQVFRELAICAQDNKENHDNYLRLSVNHFVRAIKNGDGKRVYELFDRWLQTPNQFNQSKIADLVMSQVLSTLNEESQDNQFLLDARNYSLFIRVAERTFDYVAKYHALKLRPQSELSVEDLLFIGDFMHSVEEDASDHQSAAPASTAEKKVRDLADSVVYFMCAFVLKACTAEQKKYVLDRINKHCLPEYIRLTGKTASDHPFKKTIIALHDKSQYSRLVSRADLITFLRDTESDKDKDGRINLANMLEKLLSMYQHSHRLGLFDLAYDPAENAYLDYLIKVVSEDFTESLDDIIKSLLAIKIPKLIELYPRLKSLIIQHVPDYQSTFSLTWVKVLGK